MATVEILLAEIAENIKSLADVSPLSATAILDLLKTVDGSGSGLDADTVDGVSIVSNSWTNSSGVTTPALAINGQEIIWLSNTNWYLVTGCDFVAGAWRYNSTGQAIVVNSYSGGKLQFRHANLGGHIAGDAITWTVDTYLTLDTHNHDTIYSPLSHNHNDVYSVVSTGSITSFSSGVTASKNVLRKISITSGVVSIGLNLDGTISKNNGTVLADLPVGYRPTISTVNCLAYDIYNSSYYRCALSTNGGISLPYNSLTASWGISITATYPI